MTAKNDSYLRDTRIGVFSTSSGAMWPVSIPIWYEWDGETIQMFSAQNAVKVRRTQSNPYASLMVSNTLQEPEYWVAVDGILTVHQDGAFELAERLAHKYWDLSNPERAATLEEWREVATSFVRLVLTPERIRHS